MNPRTVNRLRVTRKQIHYCMADGCSKYTRGGKDYCVAHIEHHPYVQHVLSVIATREEEQRIVARKGHTAVDINGSIAQEMLQFLKVHGKRTLRRLARDMNRDSKLQEMYMLALQNVGLINVTKNKRGLAVIEAV